MVSAFVTGLRERANLVIAVASGKPAQIVVGQGKETTVFPVYVGRSRGNLWEAFLHGRTATLKSKGGHALDTEELLS